jgi:hypothetical protein
MGWRKIVGICGVALVLSACGGTAAAPPTPEATVVPSIPPTAARSPVASPAAAATASPAAARPTGTTAAAAAATKPDTVWVGNTDNEGVFLRKTPSMADRLKAYPDGTPLTIVGDDVDGDGQHWRHVKAPDGTEGYVPSMYTVNTPP